MWERVKEREHSGEGESFPHNAMLPCNWQQLQPSTMPIATILACAVYDDTLEGAVVRVRERVGGTSQLLLNESCGLCFFIVEPLPTVGSLLQSEASCDLVVGSQECGDST